MRWPPTCSAMKPRASCTRLSMRSSRSFSLCARGAGGSPDNDEPASKEAAALASALGWGTAAEIQPFP
eukprot:4745897-Pyramimonas_sp.AAC.1